MNRPLVLAILCLPIGFAIGWLARPLASGGDPAGDPVAGRAPAGQRGDRGALTLATKAGRRPGEGTTSPARQPLMNDGEAIDGAAQAAVLSQVAEPLRQRFEVRLAELATELGLGADQQARMRAELERQLGRFTATDGAEALGDPASLQELAELAQPGAPDELAAEFLSPEQAARHAALQERERQRRIEAQASHDLAALAGVLELADHQRDAIYQMLARQAARQQDHPPRQRFSDLFASNPGSGINDDPLGVRELIDQRLAQSLGSGGPDSDLVQETRFRAAVNLRVDAQVEQLRPHLSAGQLARYRTHLEHQAALLTQGAAAPAAASTPDPDHAGTATSGGH